MELSGSVTLLLIAALLGLVEGITEFIPVSSTGHLIIVGYLLGFRGKRATIFDVFIQLGAILAVIWLYRGVLLSMLSHWREKSSNRHLLPAILIGFVPVAIVGVFTHRWITAHLFTPRTVAFALVGGGIVILAVERMVREPSTKRLDRITSLTALGVGLAQVLSLFPGVSRSGATIIGGMGLGLSRKAATEFSFLLAIPVMLAATGFELLANVRLLEWRDAGLFAVGLVTSFVGARVVIRALVAFISRHTFVGFAWYRIALGLVLLYVNWVT